MLFVTSAMFMGFHQWPSAGQIFDKSVKTYIPPCVRDGPVRTLSWNMDGKQLVMVSCGKIAEVLDVSTGHPRQLHMIKDYGPICAEFVNTSSRLLMLGTTSKEVLVYDVKRKQVKERFKLPNPIKQVGCTAKDTHIVAALRNGEIRVYNNRTKRLSQKYAIPTSSGVTRLKCHSSKDNFIIAGSAQGTIALYDIDLKEPVYADPAHAEAVTSICFSPSLCDGLVVSSGRDGTLVYHDIGSMRQFSRIKVDNAITAMDFAADGMSLVTGSQTGEILIFDLRNRQKPMYRFRAHEREITNLLMQKHISTEILETCSFLEYCKPEVQELVEPPTLDAIAESSLDAQSNDTEPLHELPANRANALNPDMLSVQCNPKITVEDVKEVSKRGFRSIIDVFRILQEELQMDPQCLSLQDPRLINANLKAEEEVETILQDLEAIDEVDYRLEKLVEEGHKAMRKLKVLKKTFRATRI